MTRFAAWLVPFAVYAMSAYRTVGYWDVGEMDVVPYMFRLAHPPGAPLYVLIGWLWSHAFPFGSVAWRMSMLSAVAMSLAAWCVSAVVRELCDDAWASLAAALIFAFGSVAWAVATRADVHALETAAFALTLWRWLCWYRSGSRVDLYVAAAALGAALAIHPVAMWMLPGILTLVVARLHERPLAPLFVAAGIALTLAIVPYAFLPRDVVFAAGIEVRGAFSSPAAFVSTLLRETNVALLLALAGVAVAWRRHDVRVPALLLSGIGSTIFALGFPDESDITRYYLPLFAVLAAASGYGIGRLRRRYVSFACYSLAAVAIVWMLVGGRGFFDQPYDTRALDESNAVLRSTPDDAVLVSTWELAPTLEYRRDVDRATGHRLIVSSWYGDVADRLGGWLARRPVYVVGTPEGSVTGFGLERVATQTDLYRVERLPLKR